MSVSRVSSQASQSSSIPMSELAPDYGDVLIDAFNANPKLGAAGTLLTYPDGETVQHAGGIIKYPMLHTDHRGRGSRLSPDLEVADWH